MVVAIRIAVVFGAVFLVLSVIALIEEELENSDQVIEDLEGKVVSSHQVVDKEANQWPT